MPDQAHTLGLVDDIGLQRVVDSASNDLRWARARYASQTGIKWDQVIKQLNVDIRFANERLPDDRQASQTCIGMHEVASQDALNATALSEVLMS